MCKNKTFYNYSIHNYFIFGIDIIVCANVLWCDTKLINDDWVIIIDIYNTLFGYNVQIIISIILIIMWQKWIVIKLL